MKKIEVSEGASSPEFRLHKIQKYVKTGDFTYVNAELYVREMAGRVGMDNLGDRCNERKYEWMTRKREEEDDR